MRQPPIQPPTTDSRPAPTIVIPAPHFVIPAKAGIQRGGEGCGKTTTHSLPVISVPRYQAGTQYNHTMKQPHVYILANKRNGTLYIGVTSNLPQRVWHHKNDLVEGFTKSYGVHTLVWYETHETMESAISREKALKEWNRAWKIRLIEANNPTWRDLYQDLV